MANLYVTDQNSGKEMPLRLRDQGDGTYVLEVDVNNVGTVDVNIVTFPDSIKGQQAAANSLSVVPGTGIAGGTYWGDVNIKPVIQTPKSQIITTISGAVITAPAAGTRIVVTSFVVQLEASGISDAQMHFGATATNGLRCHGVNNGDGLTITYPAGKELKGASAQALNITQGVNIRPWGVSLLYYTEAV